MNHATIETVKNEFTIFRLGWTKEPITICSYNGKTAGGHPFDKSAKMEQYRSMGYQVTEIN